MAWYKGDSPCVGCGLPTARRKKDELCMDCKDTLKVGREHLEHLETQREGFSAIRLPMYKIDRASLRGDQVQKSMFTERPIYLQGDGLGSTRHVRDTLHDFLKTIGEGRKPENDFVVGMDDADFGIGIVVKTDSAVKFYHFYESLASYINAVYRYGHTNGHNLLGRLNSGDITESEFNAIVKKQ